ncbi:MAG: thiamine pyrophosphate-dependent enzyme [Thermodesulfobacteriota bacterium]|nr:thiamine pyrophosphate-dependent enzyme [Thermodesulfobacteriota bacterium]
MAINLKELSSKEELFASGHRLCAGCGTAIMIRQVLLAAQDPVVISLATSCPQVSTASYPYTSWKVPWIHTAFENSAATISGVEAAYLALRKKGKIDKEIKFISMAGDGGTYDIGFQSLSGALERGHKFLHICYNNEAYMNTGIQRSGATPRGASTTTSPAGKVIPGKRQFRKDLTAIIAAHNIPYVAQTTPSHWRDLMTKVQKALAADGPSFLNILTPCHRGWRSEIKDSIKIMRFAVDSCYWPLYEIEEGKWKLNHKPKKKLPVTEWMKVQRRFAHLLNPENQDIVDEIQNNVDEYWKKILIMCGEN